MVLFEKGRVGVCGQIAIEASIEACLFVVQVCVEHDDGVCQDVRDIGVCKGRVALLEVPSRKVLQDARDLLGLARQPE